MLGSSSIMKKPGQQLANRTLDAIPGQSREKGRINSTTQRDVELFDSHQDSKCAAVAGANSVCDAMQRATIGGIF